jgi:hypothetical protein
MEHRQEDSPLYELVEEFATTTTSQAGAWSNETNPEVDEHGLADGRRVRIEVQRQRE